MESCIEMLCFHRMQGEVHSRARVKEKAVSLGQRPLETAPLPFNHLLVLTEVINGINSSFHEAAFGLFCSDRRVNLERF